MLNRLCLAIAACLACVPLTACVADAVPPITVGGVDVPTSPAAIADRTTADERAALGFETAYTAATTALRFAFQLHLVPRTTSPTALAPNFCARVVAGQVADASLDKGGKALALDCKAKHAVDLARAAYDTGNGASWVPLATQALSLTRQLGGVIPGFGG